VEVALVFQNLICTTTVKVLIDSGASLNLISQEFVKLLLRTEGPIIKKALGSCKKSELPTVRVASGHKITSLGCIDFQLQLAENVISDPVRFFVFKDLPVQAIVGHKTNSQWKATLSWETSTWKVIPTGMSHAVIVPWKGTSPHWRAPFKLLVNGEFVVPPRSHSKVPVLNPFTNEKSNSINGTFGYITPRHDLSTYMVAHGVADAPTWVQVANPGDTPLVFHNKSHVCYFHCREEWETETALIDESVDQQKTDSLKTKQHESTVDDRLIHLNQEKQTLHCGYH
jgi:hypothetical protein